MRTRAHDATTPFCPFILFGVLSFGSGFSSQIYEGNSDSRIPNFLTFGFLMYGLRLVLDSRPRFMRVIQTLGFLIF
ncbi:hypothetical protein QE152_g10492 [Popillia japonica]|uniref:Uncharacterized protein n=1 Tax=Popillia japonica TaxID=7064 RepID=A0AAW1LR94_POPJA